MTDSQIVSITILAVMVFVGFGIALITNPRGTVQFFKDACLVLVISAIVILGVGVLVLLVGTAIIGYFPWESPSM